MRNLVSLFTFLFISISHLAAAQTEIIFNNLVGDRSLVLNDSLYENFAGEPFTVSKLRYYISDIALVYDDPKDIKKVYGIFLIDASKPESRIIKIPRETGHLTGLTFQIGVDSILNCSGAQSGALDPLNDMFWTWNSGYVNFKLEGSSPVSVADLGRIEQHIGGFKGTGKTMRTVNLKVNCRPFPVRIYVNVDINKYWNGVNRFKIKNDPVLVTPGKEASLHADNFPGMFSIGHVTCFVP